MRKDNTIFNAMLKDSKGNPIIFATDEGFNYYFTPHRGIYMSDDKSPVVYKLNENMAEVKGTTKDRMVKFCSIPSESHIATIDRKALNEVTQRRSSKNGAVKIVSDDCEAQVFANADYIRDYCDLFDTDWVAISTETSPIVFRGAHGIVGGGMVLPVRCNDSEEYTNITWDKSLKKKPELPHKNDLIKVWYRNTFPTDSAVNLINDDVSFRRVYSALRTNDSFGGVLGTNDSTVRERVFKVLAEMNNCSYDDIYELWLHGAPASEDQIDEVAVEEVAPAHETATENATDTNELTKKLESIEGINVEVIGTWVWVDGDTKPHKEELKALGFRWSRNRGKWYKGDTSKYRGKYKSQYKDFGAMRQAYA